MKYLFLLFFLLFACTSKGLLETNQKNIFLSKENISFDFNKNSFKIEFSINNKTKKTLTNFVYQIIFKDSKGNAITTKEDFFRGAIEPNKAKRIFLLIDQYTRENFKSFDIEIKK